MSSATILRPSTCAAAFYFDAGQWDDALVQLDSAVAASEPELHNVLARALAALIAGHRDDSAALGEHLAARTAATEALELYEALGASWDIRRAVAMLRPIRIRRRPHADRRPDFGWDALTATELKIAYLVADGHSNPEIAAALYLSRNTVQTHVSHILTKLDARSRAEITTAVFAHPRTKSQVEGVPA